MEKIFDRAVVQARSDLYRQIRAFFGEQDVLEVEVPLLGSGGSTDLHLSSMRIDIEGIKYLQTSPEFFMKRLLCEGSGDIFTICKSFRAEESGRLHNPEFSMLEWYRVGFSLDDLLSDVLSLFAYCDIKQPIERFRYADIFEQHAGLHPHTAAITALKELANKSGLVGELDRSATLDFLMSTLVEPELPKGLAIIDEFPAEQAALAKIMFDGNGEGEGNKNGNRVAARFEIYWDGLELANGYHELTDIDEQKARFISDQQARADVGLPKVDEDIKFLEALESGMPECSGVAIGLDRLLMKTLGKERLADCLLFDWRSL